MAEMTQREALTGGTQPLLRWAGSKRQLVPLLRQQAPISFRRYIEPFAGSACLFFDLRPKEAIVADINSCLIQTYRSLRASPDDLHCLVNSWPRTKAFYYALRSIPSACLSSFERAGRFIYLNRNSFNGVYRTNAKGDFNVPRGTRTGALPTIERFRHCASALRSARLLDADFQVTLEYAGKGDFVYLDPPYRPAGARDRGEYGLSSFGRDDVERLAHAVSRADARGARILLSYYNTRELLNFFSKWKSRRLDVQRHVAGFSDCRRVVKELVMWNY